MRRQLVPAVRMVLVLTVVLGVAYPSIVLGFGQLLFPDKANGSLVERDGTLVGSELIGQTFTGERYFQGRPSAAGIAARGSTDAATGAPADTSDLTQAASGGTNLGPTNAGLIDAVSAAATAYREANGLSADTPVPVDAVTSSGSGLDPHISVANARLQAQRVARVRGIGVEAVHELIDQATDGRSFGFMGEPGVDVLRLNLLLDDGS